MMGPISHFLVGMLVGSAIGAVLATVWRRAIAWLPALALACGFWAEMPCLLGFPGTTHPLANIFFGYSWLHPWVRGRELVSFIAVVAVASLMLIACVAFTLRFQTMVDMVRWEHQGPEKPRRRSRRRRPSREG